MRSRSPFRTKFSFHSAKLRRFKLKISPELTMQILHMKTNLLFPSQIRIYMLSLAINFQILRTKPIPVKNQTKQSCQDHYSLILWILLQLLTNPNPVISMLPKPKKKKITQGHTMQNVMMQTKNLIVIKVCKFFL